MTLGKYSAIIATLCIPGEYDDGRGDGRGDSNSDAVDKTTSTSVKGLAYIHTCRSLTFTSAHLYGNVYIQVSVARALADSSDFELPGEQSSQKIVISCLGRRQTMEQNVTPLALSSAEKSVSVHTHTHTHKQTNSKRYIHTYVWIKRD